jgi:hypothetical protein
MIKMFVDGSRVVKAYDVILHPVHCSHRILLSKFYGHSKWYDWMCSEFQSPAKPSTFVIVTSVSRGTISRSIAYTSNTEVGIFLEGQSQLHIDGHLGNWYRNVSLGRG